MTTYTSITSFTRGEVDATLYDRVDVDFYRTASKFMDNWFPDSSGAIERRPQFAAVGSPPLLIPGRPSGVPSDVDCGEFMLRTFSFRETTYLILFRRICTPGWQTVTMSCYRQEPNDSLTVQFEDEYLVYYSNESTDLAALIGSSLPPDSHDGNEPQGFRTGIARNICIAQVGPAVFITSPLFPPYRVFVDEDGDADYELITFFEELVGTVEVESGDDEWSGLDTLFQDQLEVGDSFFFKGQEFTVDTLTDQVTLKTNETYTGLSLAGERISRVTDVFETDWPRLCAFYKGRLFLFSTRTQPVGLFASASNQPFIIRPGSVHPDAPIELELLTSGAESFRWVESSEQLFLGGEQAEYTINSLPDQPITPTNFSFYRVSNNGGTSLQPFSSNASTVFVNRGRTRLQAVRFDDQRSGFVGDDLSLLAPHLLQDRVRDVVFRPGTQNDRASRIFLLTDTKKLRTCVLNEQENVVAWSRISLAEGYQVEAVGATPDDLYAIIKCPKTDTYAMSILDVGNDDFSLLDLPLDYTLTNGQVALEDVHQDSTVAVLAGSEFLGFFEVTDTLDIGDADFNDEVKVGITFNSRLDMLPAVFELPRVGSSLNRKHRLVRVLLSITEAYELSVNGEPLFGTLATNTTTGFAKREGTYERRVLGWHERPETRIESSSIYRAKLRSVTREVNI